MANSTIPKGVRLNNPGNLVRTSQRWQGMATKQPDPRFITFLAPEWGLRALARTLLTYQERHKLRTIHGIIHRWAPPDENDTDAYVDDVCRRTGFDKDQILDLWAYDHLRPLVLAIIWHENGQQPYGDFLIQQALAMAGVVQTNEC